MAITFICQIFLKLFFWSETVQEGTTKAFLFNFTLVQSVSSFCLLGFFSNQKGCLPTLPYYQYKTSKSHFCVYMHVSLTGKKARAMLWTTNRFILLVPLKLCLKRMRINFLSQTMLCNKTVLACRLHLVFMNRSYSKHTMKPLSLS